MVLVSFVIISKKGKDSVVFPDYFSKSMLFFFETIKKSQFNPTWSIYFNLVIEANGISKKYHKDYENYENFFLWYNNKNCKQCWSYKS